MTTIQHLKNALKKSGLPLLAVYIVFTLFDQSLVGLMESQLRSPDGMSHWVMGLGALYLVNNIFFTSLATVVAIYGLTPSDRGLLRSVADFLNLTCIESVRAWGKVLIWSFALIIPGFIRFLQLIFVPFIVSLSPKYQQGEIDALKYSKKIYEKDWASLVFVFFGFQIIWSGLSTMLFDSYRLFWQTPGAALLVTVFEALIFVLYIYAIYRIYLKSVGEVESESAI